MVSSDGICWYSVGHVNRFRDQPMTDFWIGLMIGTAFGLAIALIVARLAGSAQWLARLLGFSDEKKKIRSLERRLTEKDLYIKKAIEAFKKEGGTSPFPEENS